MVQPASFDFWKAPLVFPHEFWVPSWYFNNGPWNNSAQVRLSRTYKVFMMRIFSKDFLRFRPQEWASFVNRSPEWFAVSSIRIRLKNRLFPNVLIHVDRAQRTYSNVSCVYLCLLKSTFRINDIPQSSHENGLNPLCLRQCVIRLDDWLNDLPQKLHWWGFSPVWM